MPQHQLTRPVFLYMPCVNEMLLASKSLQNTLPNHRGPIDLSGKNLNSQLMTRPSLMKSRFSVHFPGSFATDSRVFYANCCFGLLKID
jgi:hypothetical protein